MSGTLIRPGATIGILGAGQLGKMSLVAAQQLGYHTVVWSPAGDIPAMEMATHRIAAPFEDKEGFAEFCRLADVVTTEWENIPVPLLQKLEGGGKLVRPSSSVLATAQSRHAEKKFASAIGANPVPYEYIENIGALRSPEYYARLFPGILKTDRLGYDGKGQVAVADYAAMKHALARLNVPCVLEQRLHLDMEVSAIIARNARDEKRVSSIVRNTHKDGILDVTMWTPRMGLETFIAPSVWDVMSRAADALELEGILAIEFFVAGGAVWFNEMAPRPHNSFHGSIEAAHTSQFEQHIRAICNLPLGNMGFHSAFVMKNLIGDAVREWEAHIQQPQTRVHLYGKGEIKPGRKMGHMTRLVK